LAQKDLILINRVGGKPGDFRKVGFYPPVAQPADGRWQVLRAAQAKTPKMLREMFGKSARTSAPRLAAQQRCRRVRQANDIADTRLIVSSRFPGRRRPDRAEPESSRKN